MMAKIGKCYICGTAFLKTCNAHKLCDVCARGSFRRSVAKSQKKYKKNHPEYNKFHKKKYREKFPIKAQTPTKVFQALKSGKIKKEPCVFCIDKINRRVESHHNDYRFPYDITWVCRKHHQIVEREIMTPLKKLGVIK